MLTQWFTLAEIRRIRWILTGAATLWLALAVLPALLPQQGWLMALSVPVHLNSIRLCVLLDFMIFLLAWQTFDSGRRLDSVIMALTFLCAALLDFAFLTRLPGVPTLLPRANPEAAVLFWIGARLLTGGGVLLALSVPGQVTLNQRSCKLALTLVLTAMAGLITLFCIEWRGLPDAHGHARRLPSAVGTASLLLALAAGLVCLEGVRRARLRPGPAASITGSAPDRIDLLAGCLALILSETGIDFGAALPTLTGPSFRLIAAIFFYRAILCGNIKSPYAAVMQFTAQVLAATSAVRHNEQRLSRIIQNATDAIVVIDEKHAIVMANPAAAAMFGVTLENMRDALMDDYIPPRHHKAFASYLKNYAKVRLSCSIDDGGRPEYDVSGLRADGREFPLEASISSMLEGGAQFTTLILRDITERKQAHQDIQRSHDDLSRLSVALQSLRETERREIARDLNEDLGQLLAAVRIDLSLIQKQAQEAMSVEPAQLDKMDALLSTSISSLRRIASDLRPLGLDEGGLYFALQSLRKEFEARHGIDCELIAAEHDLVLDDARTTALYRVVQEALENVRRHADATLVIMRCQRRAGQLDMVIQDDGRGIRPEQLNGASGDTAGCGLVDMRERIRTLDGRLSISGEPGCGTRIELCIPLASPAQ